MTTPNNISPVAAEELKRLRDALAPFVNAYAPPQTEDPEFLDRNRITPSMTMGDFRRAHEAFHATAASGASVPEGFSLFQHDETGHITCVDQYQIENGWEKRNPRWHRIESVGANVPPGYRLVPIEPTDEMEVAGIEASLVGRPSIDDPSYVLSIFKAMLNAAPAPTVKEVPEDVRKDAERFRIAISSYDNTDILYGIVSDNGKDLDAIRKVFDAAIAASKGGKKV